MPLSWKTCEVLISPTPLACSLNFYLMCNVHFSFPGNMVHTPASAQHCCPASSEATELPPALYQPGFLDGEPQKMYSDPKYLPVYSECIRFLEDLPGLKHCGCKPCRVPSGKSKTCHLFRPGSDIKTFKKYIHIREVGFAIASETHNVD